MASGIDSPTLLCVDDNEEVARALRAKLTRGGRFAWAGWLADADRLVERAAEVCPALIVLDADMPGRDPFEALRELTDACPSTRTVVFSGHVRPDLIDAAVEAGAWGYVSKNDGEDALIDVLLRVLQGEFVLSPEVRRIYHN